MSNYYQILLRRLSSYLSNVSKVDGRLIIILSIVLYFLTILISSLFTDYSIFWYKLFRVPTLLPSFADLRVILSASESYKLGYDVLINNPCDPWNRPMNYPRIWLYLASYLGLNQSYTNIIGISLGFLFFGLVLLMIKRINIAEGIIYVAILCSPSVMLSVERGNNDLIIFSLLVLSIIIIDHGRLADFLSYTLILIASLLKIYPIAALIVILKENKKLVSVIAILCVSLYFLYIYFTFSDIKKVIAATPQPLTYSYGGVVIFNIINAILKRLFGWQIKLILHTLYIISIIICITLCYIKAKRESLYKRFVNAIDSKGTNWINSFRIGAGIYIFTFLVGVSWSYRLIFLIFTIPFILSLVKNSDSYAMLGLLSIVATLWSIAIPSSWQNIDEPFNWFLFLYFTYILILTLPVWAKKYLKLAVP